MHQAARLLLGGLRKLDGEAIHGKSPNELARRRGNPSKKALPREDNLVLLPGAKEPPKPPLTLGRAGKALWELAWRDQH